MAFVVRKIEQAGASFGKKLKALRHDRGLNISQLSVATHVHENVIRAFEADAFHALPEPIYARNFLRTYVRYLGGDERYFLQGFEDARGTCDLVDPSLLPRQKVRRARFLVTPRIFRFLAVGLVATLVLVYLGVEVRRILIAPSIALTTPIDGLTTTFPLVVVSGNVFEQADVQINGEKILLNRDGSFSTNVDLNRGLNLISVSAKKRYSKTSTVYRRVFLEDASEAPEIFGPLREESGELSPGER